MSVPAARPEVRSTDGVAPARQGVPVRSSDSDPDVNSGRKAGPTRPYLLSAMTRGWTRVADIRARLGEAAATFPGSALPRLEPMFVDTQAGDLRLERLPRNPKLGRRAGWARNPAPAARQRRLDHFLFPIPIQPSQSSLLHVPPRQFRGQFPLEPCLVYK